MGESQMSEEWIQSFREMNAQSPKLQAKSFLRAFFMDNDVDVAEVWGIIAKFEAKLKNPEDTELEESDAHGFLELMGQTMSAIQLRKALRQYDYDRSNRMSLLEFLMINYQKSVKDLMTNDIDGPPEILRALRDEVAKLKEREAAKAELVSKAEELQQAVEKGGVKSFTAKQEKDDIEKEQIPAAERAITAAKKNVDKAKAAVEAAGSELDKILAEKGLE